MSWVRGVRVALVAAVVLTAALPARCASVTIKNGAWSISVDPSSLQVVAKPKGGSPVYISRGQGSLGPAKSMIRDGAGCQWYLPARGITVTMRLMGSGFTARFYAKKPGSFMWPVIATSSPARALIWPRWEGCYIPLGDWKWRDYLIGHGPWNTTEGLAMPFWGLAYRGVTVTYIAENRFNNAISFSDGGGRLVGRFVHAFTPNQAIRQYSFSIHLSRSQSPIEPARQYRAWLIRRGEFVTMAKKLETAPKADRLRGAAHVYLWGDDLITRYDIRSQQWTPMCRTLAMQAEREMPSLGKHIRDLMDKEHWQLVLKAMNQRWPDNYTKDQIAGELSRLLERRDFYDPEAFEGLDLPQEAQDLLKRDRSTLSVSELCRLNCLALRAAFPDAMLEVDKWGNGVSVAMLNRLRQSGFDCLQLCVDNFGAVEKRAQMAVEADRMGYLLGTYDSFHTIQDPKQTGTDASWSTAQFGDPALYESGAIVSQDLHKLGGFKQTGYKLSPIAARPAVEKRVTQHISSVPLNYYFVDCDAFGEVYDDYSREHPATQEQDAAARVDRLAWIGNTFHAVVGSEGGSSYAAPAIEVAEGAFQPNIGWGDPAMSDKKSKYYVGAYYPPDGPQCFMKQVPLKPDYDYFYYDPRFRLPLYETVFHDSVVSTHHWTTGSLKFSNEVETTELTELLYQVPPLYHLNLDEFARQQAQIKKHYEFFSPLHRELGFSQMVDFDWLTSDRLVQRTKFAAGVEMIANFSSDSLLYAGVRIPPRSIIARWRNSGKSKVYTPGIKAK